MSECQANASLRAAAYFLHPTAECDKEALAKQRRTLRSWAQTQGVEIVEEFTDRRPAPDTWGTYPAFSRMIVEWIKKRSDYSYVLCLEQDQWWRSMKCTHPNARPPVRIRREAVHSRVVTSTVRKDGAILLIRLKLQINNAQKCDERMTGFVHFTAVICESESNVVKPRRRSRS
jgi:hypothetical protein